MQLLQSERAPESILPAPLHDRAFKGARVQREKRFKVVILALLVVHSPRRGAARVLAPRRGSSIRWPPESRSRSRILSVAHVDGTFRLASGRVVLDDGDLSRSTIEASIDAGSSTRTSPSVTPICAA